MNIKNYRNDIIPGYLVWRAYVAQKTREALEHPPRVSRWDWLIWTVIFLGSGYLTWHLAVMVLRP